MARKCPYCCVRRQGQRCNPHSQIVIRSRSGGFGFPYTLVKKPMWCHSRVDFYNHICEYHYGSHNKTHHGPANDPSKQDIFRGTMMCFICKRCSFTTTEYRLLKAHRHGSCDKCSMEFLTKPYNDLRDYTNRCRGLSPKDKISVDQGTAGDLHYFHVKLVSGAGL